MRHHTTLFMASLLALLLAVACSDATTPTYRIDHTNTRAADAQTQYVDFDGRMISIEIQDIVATANPSSGSTADVQTMRNLNNAFMGAEKTEQTLALNFVASDEPIDDGLYIFGIESEESKVLEMEMFDEEGFSLVANNEFVVEEGNNYKAVNVNALESGRYQFRLSDKGGKELNRQIVIED